jgi:hypothetical protein
MIEAMVAPPTAPRNAEGCKAKAALEGGPSTNRGQGQYKGRSPEEYLEAFYRRLQAS